MSDPAPVPDQDTPTREDPTPDTPPVDEVVHPESGVATRPATGDVDPGDPTKPGTPAYAQRINEIKARARVDED